MTDKPVRIMEESWDVLILLDACRYDYFEKIRQEHLPAGDLSCRTSIGSSTVEWRNNSFPGVYKDVVYVSNAPLVDLQKFMTVVTSMTYSIVNIGNGFYLMND